MTLIPTGERDFRALFEAELGFVYRVLRRQGVPERDLADACQETFLVVYRRRADFEGRSSVRTWIYSIAVRVAAAQRRKAHVTRERLTAEPGDEAGATEPGSGHCSLPLASAEQRQFFERVEAALEAVADERREVFVLYELEAMTMREVASALGIPENTAFSRLYGARDDVRAWLEKRERAVRAEGRSATSNERAESGGRR